MKHAKQRLDGKWLCHITDGGEHIHDIPASVPGCVHTDLIAGGIIKDIYYSAADGVIALQNKLGWYKIDKSEIYAKKWDAIKEVLAEAPSADVLKNYISRVGLNIADFEERYGAKKIQDAIWFAKDLKDRYSVLWLNYEFFNATL